MTGLRLSALSLAAVLIAASSSSAQWLKTPTAGMPRTPDGKPNLTPPAPGSADGSGLWRTDPGGYVLVPGSDTRFSASGAPVIVHVDATGVVTDFVVHTVEGDQKFERNK